MEFTNEELKNLILLVETGARSISQQSTLEQGSMVLNVANELIKKLQPKTKEPEVEAGT